MFVALGILALISATGFLLYTFKKVNQRLLNILIALGAGSMLSVSLVHILPEAIEQTENAIFAFILGFVGIYIIEELLTPHHHDHSHGDHSHEDPHEHYDHVALISWLAICIHTLFDGVGIRAGMSLSEMTGYAILLGVAIHQIPVSLSLAAIFRESRLKHKYQLLFLALFSISAPIGYILSDIFLKSLNHDMTGLAVAFAGGSLLYVATADLLPMIHAQSKKSYATLISFIFGVGLMTYFAGHEHHEEHGHLDETHTPNIEAKIQPESPEELPKE